MFKKDFSARPLEKESRQEMQSLRAGAGHITPDSEGTVKIKSKGFSTHGQTHKKGDAP
jgi:hypothetical protein